MNRKILLLNLALIALIALLVWQLREKRLEAAERERAVLLKGGRKQVLLASPAPPVVAPVTPAAYIDTVQKMLFSKDRNPNVIVEVPPVPPPRPRPPMPALPRYYGQIRFGGDPVVLLSSAAAKDQKGYAVGEEIGGFKVVAFDWDTITFEWDGQEVERKLSDLKPKDAPAKQQAAAAPPPPPAPSQPAVSIAAAAAANVPAVLGPDVGGGFYGCRADDPSPSGTVVDGYQKTSAQGLMGATCRWEKAK